MSNQDHDVAIQELERANWRLVSDEHAAVLRAYIVDGAPCGSPILTAVLESDLRRAAGHLDDRNAQQIGSLVLFLRRYAPASCWGAREDVERWIAKGGLRGRSADR